MKKVQLISIIIGALILIGFVSSFSYWFQFIRPSSPALEEKAGNFCAEFPKIEGEVNCEEAREIALEKYPGEVIGIDKTATSYQYGKPYSKEPLEIKTEQRDVWIIKIHLKESFLPSSLMRVPPPPGEGEEEYQYSTEKVGVVVDRYQKEILFLQSIP